MEQPDAKSAYTRLKKVVIETPLVKSRFLPSLYFKCENLQYGGSFKIRGAYNKMSQLPKSVKGVVTYSAGNHGQGVALAARWRGIKAAVVMPKNSVQSKVTATKRLGAKIIIDGETSEDVKAKAEEIANREGFTMIPPFDDPDNIAGQSTISKEIIKAMPDVKNILVQIGGGGLAAGILAGVAGKKGIRVIGVEPKGVSKTIKSIEEKRVVSVHSAGTIADGLRVLKLGKLTFEIINKYVETVVTVSETDIIETMRHILLRENLLVEPSGAVSTAAVLSSAVKGLKGNTVAILSGGNVDLKSISFELGS